MLEIRVSDWTATPGLRYRWESEWSGEQFREEVLEPKFKEAIAAGDKLKIILDGVKGFGTSFLEESFGGLARMHKPQLVLDNIQYESIKAPWYIEEILGYIEDEKERQKE